MVTRIVPWVASAVYGIVLLAGLYYALAGLSPTNPVRLLGFVAGIAALFLLEAVGWRVVRLAMVARLVLYVVVVACD